MWDATIDINLKGTFFCLKAALPHLRASKGNVVNVASDAGLKGEKGLSVYCASKGGVVNLTRALALELAPDIRVNCVCPGYVDTDMVRRDGIEQSDDPSAAEAALKAYSPLRRIAKPREIGKAIAYLASDDAVRHRRRARHRRRHDRGSRPPRVRRQRFPRGRARQSCRLGRRRQDVAFFRLAAFAGAAGFRPRPIFFASSWRVFA